MKRVAIIILLFCLQAVALADSPNDVIEEAIGELAAALDGRKDELAADKELLYETIDAILLPRFDRRYAAQLVLGRNWRDASEEQRNAFIDAFYGSLLRRYADGVLKFEQDLIELLPYRGDDTKARTQVKTIVRLDDGTKVPVNYGLVKRDTGWLMFDVTIEGISYIRNFRTEINSEIQATSLDEVIARLNNSADFTAAAQ